MHAPVLVLMHTRAAPGFSQQAGEPCAAEAACSRRAQLRITAGTFALRVRACLEIYVSRHE